MPVASSASTSKRLLALLSLLQSPRDWPAPVLAARLGVSERTVRRDIERLRELDYVIDATRGPEGGYRLGAGSAVPPLLFDDEQVVALALALRTAGSLGAGLEEAADRALATVSRLMPSRLSHRIENLVAVAAGAARGGASADPAVLLRIGESIGDGVELRFDYSSSTGAAATSTPPVRVTEPHHLLLHRGRWYLVGFDPHREDWRVYRVDRIAPRMHGGRRFAPKQVPGGDPARYLAGRFEGSADGGSWAFHGEATLLAPLPELAPYLADGTATAVDADRCRVRLGSWSWEALATEFLRFGVTVVDVQPAELGAAFTAVARRSSDAVG